jgi:hypothetical protein
MGQYAYSMEKKMRFQKMLSLSILLSISVLCPTISVYSQQSEKPEKTELHSYVDKARGFKIMVPDSAAVSTNDFNQVIFSDKEGSLVISMMPNYNQNQDASEVKKTLSKMCDAAILSSDGKEISRSMISLNGNPGCEIIASLPNLHLKMRHRAYLVKAKMVQIGLTGAPLWIDSSSVKTVLSSFTLL